VEEAVQGEQVHLAPEGMPEFAGLARGGVGGDDDFPEFRLGIDPARQGERHHVRGPLPPEEAPVEPGDGRVVHDRQGHGVAAAEALQGEREEAAQAPGFDGEGLPVGKTHAAEMHRSSPTNLRSLPVSTG
jgi:hypothetical protein